MSDISMILWTIGTGILLAPLILIVIGLPIMMILAIVDHKQMVRKTDNEIFEAKRKLKGGK